MNGNCRVALFPTTTCCLQLSLAHTNTNNAMSRLPTEILIVIIDTAWQATSSPMERAAFYHTFAATYPGLHQIFLSRALRSVVLSWSHEGSLTDMDTYRRICEDVAMTVAEDESTVTGSSAPNDAHFRQSHIILDASGLQIPDLLTKSDLNAFSSSVSITLRCPLNRPLLQYTNECLFTALASFRSLDRVYLDCYYLGQYDNYACMDPRRSPIVLQTVRFLRFKNFPMCQCATRKLAMGETQPALGPRHTDTDTTPAPLGHCIAVTLRETFPCLVELHIENVVLLQVLDLPHTLRTLTLESPPVGPGVGHDDRGSVVGFHTDAALTRGLFCWPRELDRAPPAIVVHTGKDDPEGWAEAMTACREHDVDLVKVVSYAQRPQERTDQRYIMEKMFNFVRMAVASTCFLKCLMRSTVRGLEGVDDIPL